jgi:hypothetical protein
MILTSSHGDLRNRRIGSISFLHEMGRKPLKRICDWANAADRSLQERWILSGIKKKAEQSSEPPSQKRSAQKLLPVFGRGVPASRCRGFLTYDNRDVNHSGIFPDAPSRHHLPARTGFRKLKRRCLPAGGGQAIAPPCGVLLHTPQSSLEFILSLSKERLASNTLLAIRSPATPCNFA